MKAYLKNLYMFVVLSIITLPCFGQSFIHSKDDTDSIYTEYHDGDQWIYRLRNNKMIGITCNKTKDGNETYYQIKMFIVHANKKSFTFNPDKITAYLIDKYDSVIDLRVYTYKEFQKKIISERNSKINSSILVPAIIAGMTGTPILINQVNIDINQTGNRYLKINTIYPHKPIAGYMNIERKRGKNLLVYIPIDGEIFYFEWDVGKTKKKE